MSRITEPVSPSEGSAPSDALLARAMLARLKAGKDVRRLKVERVREAILDNEYENVLKLTVAADRVVEEMETSSPPSGPRIR